MIENIQKYAVYITYFCIFINRVHEKDIHQETVKR